MKIYETKKFFTVFVLNFFCILDIYATDSVKAKGVGHNENQAISDAKKQALAKFCGETILGSTKLSSQVEKISNINPNGEKTKTLSAENKTENDVMSLVAGTVKSIKVLSKTENNGLVTVEIDAVGISCKDTSALKDSVTGTEMIAELRKINLELAKIGTSDALISQPKSLAQKYHNARILIQRGEIDRAQILYEELVAQNFIFADPIIDLTSLLSRLYGPVAAAKYIDQKLGDKMPTISREYSKLLLNKNAIKDEISFAKIKNIIKNDENFLRSFPPLSRAFLERTDINKAKKEFSVDTWKILRDMSVVLKESVDSGDYYAFYLDQTRAESDLQSLDISTFTTGNKLLDTISGEWAEVNWGGCFARDGSVRHRISSKGFGYYRDDETPIKLVKISEDNGEISAVFSNANQNNNAECVLLTFKNISDDGADMVAIYPRPNQCNKPDTAVDVRRQKWVRCTLF